MSAYYNEHDPSAAAWLRQLIKDGLIPPGDVDERSIEDVLPTELMGYTQHHFFAGIGGWPYALRLAGWPDDKPAATGSCPCQPFSSAGKGEGTADERHLWPDFKWIIDQCRFPIIFGEQTASKAGREWLAGVRIDLESMGYVSGAADLCAAGVGAPHIRQRLFWVANSAEQRSRGFGFQEQRNPKTSGRSEAGGLANRDSDGRNKAGQRKPSTGGDGVIGNGSNIGIPNPNSERLQTRKQPGQPAEAEQEQQARPAVTEFCRPPSYWADAIWIDCADGKRRRIKSGVSPLAHGIPGRVGLIRGYGNAIVPWIAAEFIRATMESTGRT